MLDCGEVKNTVHQVQLKDKKPFCLPYRKVPPAHYLKLRQTLNEMKELGIIEKSNSEWASPLFLVWKPSGELRICRDFIVIIIPFINKALHICGQISKCYRSKLKARIKEYLASINKFSRTEKSFNCFLKQWCPQVHSRKEKDEHPLQHQADTLAS